MAPNTYTAFAGHRLLASGEPAKVAAAAHAALSAGESRVLIFSDATGEQVELDPTTATPAIAIQPPSAPVKPGRGRPKLGVTAREVTLLPRHWAWLATQPGGASAALRRLVETASRSGAQTDLARARQDAAYRVMTSLAGDLPGYEEALRALFKGDREQLSQIISPWPKPVAEYVRRLTPA
ncbi:DUF2239 family protein [Phenylobacterium sp.]|jgi:hypothetical protein|uniref:DUF2239 family protein n=1 Tax=Phenylobacterium sp. TaxID=1871053 RepID=UPI002F935715